MKALITGSEGFVGHYLRDELASNGYGVIGADLREAPGTVAVDLLDPVRVDQLFAREMPDIIIHLAGQANVFASWKIPSRTFELNIGMAINLMESVRKHVPDARIVLVGSSDEYGSLGNAGESVSENTEMKPMNPYAISKKAQEDLGRAYAKAYGMKICMTRSFNHGGAGQRPGFMIPDFADGIVKVERGLANCVMVGNLSSRRDFTHVRDVVRAYRLIAEKGCPGEVYNVGSGITYSAGEILERMISKAVCPVQVEQDPAKMRPSDTPVVCCCHDKLTKDTGWMPRLGMEEIIDDTLSYYRHL